MSQEFGFLILAFGKQRYIDQGVNLALSLKRYMPDIPVAFVTDSATKSELFDVVVPIDLSRGGSFIQKLWLDAYSPFKKTLFIDSDCIVGSAFHAHIEAMMLYPFTPVCERYLGFGERDEDGWVKDIGSALKAVGGESYPKFNGGVYYFDDSEAARAVFARAREFVADAKRLGLTNPSGGEAGDETVFALALSSLRMLPLYDDQGGLMRTPIGISGPLRMNSEFGDFSFRKYREQVRPAICHFAGANVYSLPYLRIVDFLCNGKPTIARTTQLYYTYLTKGAPHYLRQIKYKLRSLKQGVSGIARGAQQKGA